MKGAFCAKVLEWQGNRTLGQDQNKGVGSQREAGGVGATESCRPYLKRCILYPESNGNMARISSL